MVPRLFRVIALLCVFIAKPARAQAPYGLDARLPIAPYLNGVLPPRAGAFPFPPTLSATGAFRDLATLSPADGLIPFAPNSALWTDGAIKTRWMAVPNDGPPYGPVEQIGFVPVGEWNFPNGTVFVKEFDMTINEGTGARKRLETRLLVRNVDGGVYGLTYKWRTDQSDADLLPGGLEEDLVITDAAGAMRIQRYTYPSRQDCLFCHNPAANYVLGAKTHQLNGDLTYPATGRTDNQLRTLNHLAMFDPAPDESSFAGYLRSVSISNQSAPVEYRMRSWIDSNCSHCHRPGGPGPGYDGRLYTPLANQNLINNYVRFRNPSGSLLFLRDNALDNLKMPPLAKNVVHAEAMANLRQWIASPFAILSVHLHGSGDQLAVRFNSRVAPDSLGAATFTLDGVVVVTAIEMSNEPDTVILRVAGLGAGESHQLTVSGVRDTASSANTIWPGSSVQFVAEFPSSSNAGRLANISSRVFVQSGDRVSIDGFIARGGTSKRVLVRGIGPSLVSSDITGVLVDPAIELFNGNGNSIASNDNWQENANRQEIIDTGAAPLAPNESAIIATLPSGAAGLPYTVVLRGARGTSGIGLVEVYDLDREPESELVNISTRGFVATGDNVMIGGVIIDGLMAKRIIVRAIGPSLTQFGVGGALADPTLTLFNSNGDAITANDNWRDSQAAEIEATTIPPRDERESAIVATLPPSHYTAIVRGREDTEGVALIEVYTLPQATSSALK